MGTATIRENLGLGFLLGVAFTLLLVSCSPEAAQQTSPVTSSIPLTAYSTSTPTPLVNPDSADLSPTLPPTPTATPFIYLIQSGDTLLGIAQRFNVTLDELLASNPAIDPNFLIVGDEVIIPTGEGSLAVFAAPTPIAVELAEPRCYPVADGGLWCLVMARNPLPGALENVSAQITLFDPAGEKVDQQLAIAPLNVVPVGEAVPMAVLFPGPIPANFSVQTDLSTALPLEPGSDRYIQINIAVEKIEIAATSGVVEGLITLAGEEGNSLANQVWVAALAFDAEGSIVGLRKWESTAQISPGDALSFQITVYSLGPSIAEIQVQGEARP